MEIEEKRKLKSFIQAHENEDEVISKLEEIDIEMDLDGGTPLNHAVNYDRTKIVKFLIGKGANVNAIQDGYSPIMSACEGNNFEIVKMLIDADADMNFKDSFGNNALWKATFNENEELVKLLLEHGANPQEKFPNGETIYECAQRMELDGVLKVFDEYSK